MAFINCDHGYYEGDQIDPADLAVPQRPDFTYAWNGSAWQPTAETHNAPILAEIATMESSVSERRLREAVLGTDNGWLKNINDQIAALRSQLIMDGA